MRHAAGALRLLGKRGLVIILVGVFWGGVVWPESANARRVFHWIDERGVACYSHSPPPPGVKFEARRMPTPRPTPLRPSISEGEPVEGEAFVVLTDQSVSEIGPLTRRFTGEVTNNGDRAAGNVVVSITVKDDERDAHCLTANMEVTPSTLEPGESGTYEDEFDHPCFRGNASVELKPEWQ
jgi:hypothetical protein